jgi:excisionase family DNA binding protein
MKEAFEQLNKKLNELLAELHAIKAMLPLVNPPPTAVKTYTIPEAAAYLRLSVARIYELLYTGKLHSVQRKKYCRILFTTEQLNQYLYENK